MDIALERLDFAGERFLGEGRYIYHFSPKKRLGTNPEPPGAIRLFCPILLVYFRYLMSKLSFSDFSIFHSVIF